MLELLKIILIGLIEGITEWLPISSTGHMILVEEFVQLQVRPEFWDIFIVVIQLGAILAVIWIYFNRLNPFSPQKTKKEKQETWETWFKVAVGCIPAAVLGLLIDDWMEAHLMNWLVVALALIIYGIAFILVENYNKTRRSQVNSMQELTYRRAFEIGLFQCLSLVPGTSRSGSSILGATILGTSRPVAADFSFFMSIPIMFGASFLKLVKAFFEGFRFTGTELGYLAVGMVVAFLVSVITIKLLLRYIQSNDFKPFGWYRIVLGLIVIIYFAWIR
ncbi:MULTISPECIES: undecaprenyl-diphosphate phosphatase [Aerococcus]|uniref:Undecaprenyl-diphosphatase n=2 Tax=Aerococcus TaxID=1375 RepID=A0A5N1GL94_9LACT|nr:MULTISPECIES: undecaprenyl-diphosphate phosphatase [Aerococcus]KAA9301753.1 undecaprenyl-diphosphate phosphatase [Aerococcus sanguinicola]MDK6368831.1 undecaprenyl-diphosphate phosphatase [Aerococcus sp. UMB9870]MDK6680169.1 undecaprenyl-diphosphate phosphatase [Aerococcus sp. UMB8608]MDK6685726.1 undecaprenyl-diphosphate phosphatase [Aerococcus sp. UMB8623]MDK6939455.1 undecaprenyl-diphosphate phosphatase [Aerococcus sp. UMB8487]